MKIANFSYRGAQAIGLVMGDQLVPLNALVPDAPTAMLEVIEQWEVLRHRVNECSPSFGEKSIPLASVNLHAPIARPGKILAIGLNYADHIKEAGLEYPKHQVWFCKHTNTVAGPYDPVEIPVASANIDHEIELVVVIGKRGRHISVAEAPNHVFGYCVGNDVSVRDWQLATPQWMLAKSFDTHGPFGPWVSTADEIGDPHGLGIRCYVNGELRQNSNTSHLVFTVWDQIAHLSKAMTLEPGDMIFTGTPGGVGWLAHPRRVLSSGDVVRCEIEALGAIENRFENEREAGTAG